MEEKGLTLRQETTFPETAGHALRRSRVDRPVRATLNVRRPGWCTGMAVRVNGRRWNATAGATGYVAIDREWRPAIAWRSQLPMTLRAEPLPATTDVVAFVYGPIVLAGRLGREGLAPGNQIIVNERESGKHVECGRRGPAARRRSPTLAKRIRQDPR